MNFINLQKLPLAFKTNIKNLHSFKTILKNKFFEPKNLEIRRRIQASNEIELALCQSTIFDFFTKDSIYAIFLAKKIAQIFGENFLTEDCLFLALSEIYAFEIFKQYNISKDTIISLILQKTRYINYSPKLKLEIKKSLIILFDSLNKSNIIFAFDFFSYLLKIIKKFLLKLFFIFLRRIGFLFVEKKYQNFFYFIFRKYFIGTSINEIFFDKKIYGLLEEIITHSRTYYKTPIISAKLFYLGLTELKFKNFLSALIPDESIRLEINYLITKNIYNSEHAAAENISKNRKNFFYIIKSGSTENKFIEMLNKSENFINIDSLIFSFRNFLVVNTLKLDTFYKLEEELFKSAYIKSTNRKYNIN